MEPQYNMAFLYGIVGWTGPRYSFLRLLRTSVAPEDFGAVGDGITDDSTAVQAAVDTGSHVYCKNNYLIESTVSMDGNTHQTIFGGGTFKLADNRELGTQIFDLYDCWNITFSGVKFNGNKANQTQPPDDNSWNSGAPRIYFTPVTANRCRELKVEGCEFYNSCTVCLNITGTYGIHVYKNHFHDSYMDALFANIIELEAINNYAWVHGNLIEDITYRDELGDIIHRYGNGMIFNSSNLSVTYNTIRRCDRTGMKPIDNNNMHDIYVAHNKIYDCDWQGINPQGGYNIIIEDNEIDGSGWNGILVAGSAYPIYNVDVKRNIITNSGIRDIGEPAGNHEGILITGDTYDMRIEENLIDGTGRFGIYYVYCHDVSTKHNIIRNTLHAPIHLLGEATPSGQKSVNVLFEDDELYCRETVVNGIEIYDYSQNVTFRGVKIYDPASYGITLLYPDGTLIDNCEIDNSNFFGIRISSATNTIIRNTTISNIRLDGILVSSLVAEDPAPDEILIEINTFDTIGRDGVRLYTENGTPTNVTIEEDNTFIDVVGEEVSWI